MKAQWDYRGPHVEERLRREGREVSVTGRLAACLVLLLAVSFVIFMFGDLLKVVCLLDFASSGGWIVIAPWGPLC